MADAPLRTGGGAGPFSGYEFGIAWRYLGATRQDFGVAFAAAFALFGVAAGVWVLIVVMSVMTGFRAELMGNLLGARAHIYVDAGDFESVDLAPFSDRMAAIEGVAMAGPVATGFALAQSAAATGPAQIYGIRKSELERLPLAAQTVEDLGEIGILRGSLEEFGEGRNGGDVILLGSGLARQLRVGVGDSVTLRVAEGAPTPFGNLPGTKSFRVGAVVTAGVNDLDVMAVVMPFEQASLFLRKAGRADAIELRIAQPEQVDPVLARVRAAAPEVFVYDWRQTDTALFAALQFERNLMRLLMLALILIVSLNIISTLVMLVRNKRRDIAILRTMGATRGAVLRIFLIVGSTIGMAGAAAGLVIGILTVVNIEGLQRLLALPWDAEVRYLYLIPAELDWREVGIVMGFCFITSIVMTLLPAWLAARLDPVKGIRNE